MPLRQLLQSIIKMWWHGVRLSGRAGKRQPQQKLPLELWYQQILINQLPRHRRSNPQRLEGKRLRNCRQGFFPGWRLKILQVGSAGILLRV
jgi:hypothetical protein